MPCKIFVRIPERKGPLGRPKCGGRIVLNLSFKILCLISCTGLIDLWKGIVAGSCDHGSARLGSTNGLEFLELLHDC